RPTTPKSPSTPCGSTTHGRRVVHSLSSVVHSLREWTGSLPESTDFPMRPAVHSRSEWTTRRRPSTRGGGGRPSPVDALGRLRYATGTNRYVEYPFNPA